MNKKTNAQFLQQMSEINPYIEPLEVYDGEKVKILCKCLVCLHTWKAAPSNLLRKKGCPVCANQKRGKDRLSHEEFVARMQKINNNIEFKSEYVLSSKKVLCKCKLCGTEWAAAANSLLSGTGCPSCARERAKRPSTSQEEFESRVLKNLPFIEILSEYKGIKSYIKCHCDMCNKTFEAQAATLLRGRSGHRCPKNCMSQNKKPEQFEEELRLINDDIILLESYVSTDTKIHCQCKKCDNQWYTNPSDLLNGHGCPCCNVSRGEKAIYMYAKNHNLQYTPQYAPKGCKYKVQLRFDVFFPQYNIIVEYDGRQHFESIERWGGDDAFAYTKARDEVKNQYCLDHGITMVRIPYWEYKNINKILDTYFA